MGIGLLQLASSICTAAISIILQPVLAYGLRKDEQGTERILAALKTASGNKAKAARLLNIDRSTLYRKIQELHINADIFG